MEFLHNLTDDQVAVIGGLVALAASGAMMYASYFVGPASRQNSHVPARDHQGEPTDRRSTVPTQPAAESTSRKAA